MSKGKLAVDNKTVIITFFLILVFCFILYPTIETTKTKKVDSAPPVVNKNFGCHIKRSNNVTLKLLREVRPQALNPFCMIALTTEIAPPANPPYIRIIGIKSTVTIRR